MDRMLKAELHCHIEGAADPALVRRLARKHGVDVSSILDENGYRWHDFTSFLHAYDTASKVFQTPEDYRLLTFDYYRRLSEQNAIYGEVFASPDHAAQMGIGYADLIAAMSDGIDQANEEFGIEGRIIVICVRHLGARQAEATAQALCQNPHPKVTGFGMAGDERAYEVEDFAVAFKTAADAGVGLTAHAGELRGPKSVRDALDHLGVTRIGHGVRAIEDLELVERLADEDIVCEVCPGSNLALGIYPDEAAHPLRKLVEAGVRVTLNSDDPPFFHTSLAEEYELAARLGLDDQQIRQTTRTSIKAAFVDDATRHRLLAKLDAAD